MSFKTIIYLEPALPRVSSDPPEDVDGPSCCPLLGLASDGVYNAPCVATGPVVSYTALSPLPLAGRSALCCTFPGVASAGR